MTQLYSYGLRNIEGSPPCLAIEQWTNRKTLLSALYSLCFLHLSACSLSALVHTAKPDWILALPFPVLVRYIWGVTWKIQVLIIVTQKSHQDSGLFFFTVHLHYENYNITLIIMFISYLITVICGTICDFNHWAPNPPTPITLERRYCIAFLGCSFCAFFLDPFWRGTIYLDGSPSAPKTH